ncbi:MAG: class I SAM-dependent methyltransferase [Planctomycetota bacterium]|nr:class I SAM-dependent methyltransferase [Planctomycetota bacterium]
MAEGPSPSEEITQADYSPQDFWNGRLDKNFTLSGVGHTNVGLAFNRWAYAVRKRVLLRNLRAHGVPIGGARILELAFGTGYYLDLWRALGAKHVTGFDIAFVAARAATERFKDLGWRFLQGDIGKPLDLQEARGACDLATAFDVLFHVVDESAWNAALDNLTAALKPGGHLAVFDKFQRVESAGSHVRRRTFETYEAALKARGYEIVGVRPIFFFMNSPTDLEGLSGIFFRLGWSLAKLPYRVGKLVGLGEVFGWLSGAALYLPELFFGLACSNGPGTKLLLARKK